MLPPGRAPLRFESSAHLVRAQDLMSVTLLFLDEPMSADDGAAGVGRVEIEHAQLSALELEEPILKVAALLLVVDGQIGESVKQPYPFCKDDMILPADLFQKIHEFAPSIFHDGVNRKPLAAMKQVQ
jgi:hypothetical protein